MGSAVDSAGGLFPFQVGREPVGEAVGPASGIPMGVFESREHRDSTEGAAQGHHASPPPVATGRASEHRLSIVMWNEQDTGPAIRKPLCCQLRPVRQGFDRTFLIGACQHLRIIEKSQVVPKADLEP